MWCRTGADRGVREFRPKTDDLRVVTARGARTSIIMMSVEAVLEGINRLME